MYNRRSHHGSRFLIATVVAATAAGIAGLPGTASTADASTPPGARRTSCPPPASPRPTEGPSAEAVVVQQADADRPGVALVRYPRPDRAPGGTNPWSQWGQALVLRDGRVLSAMGDHQGRNGNSYVFVYDPETKRLTRFGDVLSHVDHRDGAWGYGKIHGQIVAGRCGEAFFATYWGSPTGLEYGDGYTGDLVFRIDTSTLSIEPLGVPVPEHGVPSLAGFGRDELVYGEAVDPHSGEARDQQRGELFVYDTVKRKTIFRSSDRTNALFRNIMIDGRGRAYVADADGKLLVYEKGASELRPAGVQLPGGGWLRASTKPAPDGTVYGVTQGLDEDSYWLFALQPDMAVRSLGKARGYTASLALDARGSRLYYVPGAHGDSYETGTPVMAVDTRTGEQDVLVELNRLAEDELGLTLGGSYSVAFDAKRRVLYVGLNAGVSRDDPWGEVALAVISLP
jgi:hypothetical protein